MSESPYLAKQFSGTLAQNTINAVLNQYQQSDPLLDYWYNLSIDTADVDELKMIGYLVGYLWPTSPSGTFDDRVFTLGSAASYPTIDTNHGLSGIDSISGGLLSTNSTSVGQLIPIEIYRSLLKAIAYAKYYGLSYQSIDNIVKSFGNLNYVYVTPYVLTFQFGAFADYPQTDSAHGFGGIGLTTGGLFTSVSTDLYPDSDITIAFTSFLSTSNLWVLQQVFTALCTSPQVFVKNGV